MNLNYRYFIKLDYNGSAFHGWQIQPNAITVQETLEFALSKLLKEEIKIVGCGRTDTGVHAKNFIAHFDSTTKHLESNNPLLYKLNKFIPKQIVVHSIHKVPNDAHSRFDATSRTYKYFINRKKDVFNFENCYNLTLPLNILEMKKAAEKLFSYIDFTSFSKINTDTKTNNCTIMQALFEEIDDQLIFTIKADRFLRNMVRAIVGTLLDVGKGKISVDDFCKIIESKDRCKAGASAPGNALFLIKVTYPFEF
ncbi:MAG: tRNA pseudouridine(38-40) synthase TruA [Salinivirgaceae bacterium]|nr:tRNA pseudouridine(38-40) synthase TruA [Salinivirgaceae bacterium]